MTDDPSATDAIDENAKLQSETQEQINEDDLKDRELSAIEELESQVSEPISQEDATSILSKSATGEI